MVAFKNKRVGDLQSGPVDQPISKPQLVGIKSLELRASVFFFALQHFSRHPFDLNDVVKDISI